MTTEELLALNHGDLLECVDASDSYAGNRPMLGVIYTFERMGHGNREIYVKELEGSWYTWRFERPKLKQQEVIAPSIFWDLLDNSKI